MVSAFKSESSPKDAQHRPLDTQGLADAHKPSLQLKGGGSDPGAGLTSVLPPSQQPDAAGLPMHHHRPSLPPSPSQPSYYHQGGGQAPLSAPTSPSIQAANIYPSMSAATGGAAGAAEPPRRNSVPILSSSSERKRVPSGEGPVDYHGFRAGPTPPGYNSHSGHGSSQSYSSWGGAHSQSHPDQYYYREERAHTSMPQHTGYYHVGGPIEYRGVHDDTGAPVPPPSASHIDHHNTYSYASSNPNGNDYAVYPPPSSSASTSSSSSSSSHGGGTLHRHNSLPTGSSLSHLSHQHLSHPHHSHHPTSHLPHSHHHSQHHPPLLPQTSQPSQTSQPPQPHHQQANKHPCKFPNCGWSFKRFEHLKRHMLVHTKERPFVCDFQGCEKSFSRSDNFSAHLRTHTKKTQQMRRYDRPLVDGLRSFRGAVGMSMSGGLPMGVGDHTHHRHSIAGYPPSYAGARSPLEGPIDPYAQGRGGHFFY
ncbi:hypothetical protein BGZ73_002132 [Actinomortierella ambigua]|nr:hypothetical protein BGZ73_002132 [Actinomortierella ambigua]